MISETYKTIEAPANPDTNAPNPLIKATTTTSATFQINNDKLYVPLVTMSINNNINILENIKQGFSIKNNLLEQK